MSDDDRDRLGKLLAEQAALRRVATLVAASAPPTVLFDQVCRELGGVLEVKSTDMVRYGVGDAVVVGAWAADGQPSFPVGERIPVDGETVTAKLLRTGRPQRVDDYRDVGGPLAERLRDFGILSVVGAPITVAGRLWGGIMATSERASAFPLDTEHRMADFAELVTAALANADAREELAGSRARIVAAADEARRRIERDLHDGAQQRLVSLALSLRLLQGRLDPRSEATAELEAARRELDHALAELRELARGIHPSVLTDRGLEAALSGLASRSPVPVTIDTSDCDELPKPLQTTAYYLIAEALTNAAKHADCDRVDVRVSTGGGIALVEIRDEGAGGADPASGTGLRGLADRVNALGGTLEIDSPLGAGTTIRARLGTSRESLDAVPA